MRSWCIMSQCRGHSWLFHVCTPRVAHGPTTYKHEHSSHLKFHHSYVRRSYLDTCEPDWSEVQPCLPALTSTSIPVSVLYLSPALTRGSPPRFPMSTLTPRARWGTTGPCRWWWPAVWRCTPSRLTSRTAASHSAAGCTQVRLLWCWGDSFKEHVLGVTILFGTSQKHLWLWRL